LELKFAAAKRLCGLADEFDIVTTDDFVAAIRAWKARTVDARQAGDDGAASVLSQCKEAFKRRHSRAQNRHCPRCGVAKQQHARHCQVCARAVRNGTDKSIPERSTIMTEHEIEDALMPIPHARHGDSGVTEACRKLAAIGQIGDSFITSKSASSVNNASRPLGLRVMVRLTNPMERDRKKQFRRVWRSDGLRPEEVNEIIRKRLAGEAVPAAKLCVAND
jgi:hypothetical protein